MLGRDKRSREKKEWFVGDIIIFGEEGARVNYGMIIVIENQFDLVILKVTISRKDLWAFITMLL